MSKPSIPRGTRDFGPKIMAKRKYIMNTIEQVYQSFGFMPLETPSMENLSTLTGKYGAEGDQLLFKVLNSGDYLKDISADKFESKILTPLISEKGLRYDLTVPLARYVVMNQNEVTFPFKRYKMQPVWRADRPQKGRYREFWQCDADVLGSPSLLCEADFVKIYRQVFAKLKLTGYEIRINHRKLLEAVVEKADASTHFKTITIIIDKADKIGIDGVKNELINLDLNENQTTVILSLLNKQAFNAANLANIKSALPNTENANKAIGDLTQLLELLSHQTDFVYLDGSLARGLDYYTGCIFEVVPTDVQMGSISGGGRYDDLTGIFGLKGISGIGISFGIDRIYDVMEELNIFPADGTKFTDVLFCCMDEKAFAYCLPLADNLRLNGIKTEVYPDTSKLKKQLDYANAKNISWAVIIGENEMNNNQLAIKNLVSGEQELIDKNALTLFLEKL